MLARFRRALCEPIEYEYISTSDDSGGRDLFEVIGTRGNLYNVSINLEKKSTCNCADFRNRGQVCKHIILIFLKHYSLNMDQIHQLSENLHLGLNDVLKETTDTSLSSDACPICFQDCNSNEWNCEVCKKVMHFACVMTWFEISSKQGISPSCPMCRHHSAYL